MTADDLSDYTALLTDPISSSFLGKTFISLRSVLPCSVAELS